MLSDPRLRTCRCQVLPFAFAGAVRCLSMSEARDGDGSRAASGDSTSAMDDARTLCRVLQISSEPAHYQWSLEPLSPRCCPTWCSATSLRPIRTSSGSRTSPTYVLVGVAVPGDRAGLLLRHVGGLGERRSPPHSAPRPALEMALAQRTPAVTLIHHNDCGCPNSCRTPAPRARPPRHLLQPEPTRRGWDNPLTFYNRERRHSALGNRAPPLGARQPQSGRLGIRPRAGVLGLTNVSVRRPTPPLSSNPSRSTRCTTAQLHVQRPSCNHRCR